jgi:hypothetical protein
MNRPERCGEEKNPYRCLESYPGNVTRHCSNWAIAAHAVPIIGNLLICRQDEIPVYCPVEKILDEPLKKNVNLLRLYTDAHKPWRNCKHKLDT